MQCVCVHSTYVCKAARLIKKVMHSLGQPPFHTFSGCRVKPRRPRSRQTCTFEGPGLQKHHQNSTKRPPKREKRNDNCGGRGKKGRNFGRSSGGVVRWRGHNTQQHNNTHTPTHTSSDRFHPKTTDIPTLRDPPFGTPLPDRPHPSGPHSRSPPPSRRRDRLWPIHFGGHNQFWRIQFWQIHFCHSIFGLVCVMVGPRGGGQTQKQVGTRTVDGWGLKGGEAPNFELFFPSPTSMFALSVSGGLLVEFWWCVKCRNPQMCAFEVLWLSCEAPAAQKPPRFHTPKSAITASAHARWWPNDSSWQAHRQVRREKGRAN